MTFSDIKKLLDILPDTSMYFKEVFNYSPTLNDVNRFLCAYKDLMFGFRFVSALVMENIALPAYVDNEALNKLYMYLKYHHKDDNIIYTTSLHHPSCRNIENCIKASLFSNASFDEISEKLGLPKKVIEYYSDLFYNIRDRKSEALFIADIVYPETRMIEFDERYSKNEAFSTMLIRSAYNNGLDDSLYLMGLSSSSDVFKSNSTAVESATKLEASIMANGLFLARNGYLNQKNTGLSSAKNILIAAKQSGMESSNSDDSLPSGDFMWQALQDIKGPEKEHKLELIEQNELAKLEKI